MQVLFPKFKRLNVLVLVIASACLLQLVPIGAPLTAQAAPKACAGVAIKNYCIHPGARLAHANLAFANLFRADLTGANLTAAKLTSVKMTNTKMTGANLTRTNLTGANLTGATR